MTDSEFQEQATRTLGEIEQAVEASGADVDFETVSEVLTLEFHDGSKLTSIPLRYARKRRARRI